MGLSLKEMSLIIFLLEKDPYRIFSIEKIPLDKRLRHFGLNYDGNIFNDDDGYFYFKGREDDIINTSGYRVGPSEIEDCILSHSEVEMVGVIGVPDEIRGNVIKAFIVPMNKENVLSQNDKIKLNIQNLVKLKLAAHEYPRIIEFVKELPMTTTGKIIRKKLRENNK